MDEGEQKINKFYVALAFVVLILLIITFLFSGNQIIRAIVPSDYLTDNWDDLGEATYEERVFGLEKQASIKYGIEDDYDNSAFLRVTTFKTIFMVGEDELINKTDNTIIQSSVEKNITLNQSSVLKGSRILRNGHKTSYIIYNGSIFSNNFEEKVVLIGETWNCPSSGTSIICIGYAQITDNENSLGYNYDNLAKIIGDAAGTFVNKFNEYDFIKQDSLIFNVKCH